MCFVVWHTMIIIPIEQLSILRCCCTERVHNSHNWTFGRRKVQLCFLLWAGRSIVDIIRSQFIHHVHKTRLSLFFLVNLVLRSAWWAAWDWATFVLSPGSVKVCVCKCVCVCEREKKGCCRLEKWFDSVISVMRKCQSLPVMFDFNIVQFFWSKAAWLCVNMKWGVADTLPYLRWEEREGKREKSKRWREAGLKEEREGSDVCVCVIETDGGKIPPSLHRFILLFHDTMISCPHFLLSLCCHLFLGFPAFLICFLPVFAFLFYLPLSFIVFKPLKPTQLLQNKLMLCSQTLLCFMWIFVFILFSL